MKGHCERIVERNSVRFCVNWKGIAGDRHSLKFPANENGVSILEHHSLKFPHGVSVAEQILNSITSTSKEWALYSTYIQCLYLPGQEAGVVEQAFLASYMNG